MPSYYKSLGPHTELESQSLSDAPFHIKFSYHLVVPVYLYSTSVLWTQNLPVPSRREARRSSESHDKHITVLCRVQTNHGEEAPRQVVPGFIIKSPPSLNQVFSSHLRDSLSQPTYNGH